MSTIAQLAANWDCQHPPAGALIEEKRDGWRAIRLRGVDGVPRLYSRNGMILHGTEHILHRLDAMERVAGEPMVFDGEYQVAGTLIDTKAWCERGWKHGGEAGTLYLFDCLLQSEWERGGSAMPLHERKARLRALYNLAEAEIAEAWDWRPGSYGRDADRKPVEVLPHSLAFEARDVVQAACDVWAMGREGVMIKAPDSPYIRSRSRDWMKVGRPYQNKLGCKAAA